jgi:hypothetical protein
MKIRFALSLIVVTLCASRAAFAAPTCPIIYGIVDIQKTNKLFLYFPASDDNTYPEFGIGQLLTSPARKFDPTELTSYTGTAAALRDRTTDVVVDDYCEFNVKVMQTTTAPSRKFARRNTVAIGTDADPTGTGTFGLAQTSDLNDATAVDFARVWAGTYQVEYGFAGLELSGKNSTLDRWARALGGTAAHEGGHSFGEAHPDGFNLAPGEDVLTHHLMAPGSVFSGEDRAGFRRHFSDHEYAILASNVGLSIQTMWNWDFINRNAQTGEKLRLTFLSPEQSLILSWSYSGGLSPWINPAVSGPFGTRVFNGKTYNKYTLTWSTAQAWQNGAPGKVPGGTAFHIGATFSGVDFTQPPPIIITDIALLDGSNNTLALHPRFLSYDSGVLDQARGTLDLRFFNVAAQSMVLQNVVVRDLPRVLSLNQMVVGGRMEDAFGLPFRPFPQGGIREVLVRPTPVQPGETLTVPVAKLGQRRYIDEVITQNDCDTQDRLRGRDTRRCVPGRNVSLFPGTTMYVTAQIVDPRARYWDRIKKKYVTGPLTSTLFYQVAGRHLRGDPPNNQIYPKKRGFGYGD